MDSDLVQNTEDSGYGSQTEDSGIAIIADNDENIKKFLRRGIEISLTVRASYPRTFKSGRIKTVHKFGTFYRIADVSGDRRADQAAHGDNCDFVRGRAGTSLKQDLAKTRNRFRFLDTADALKRSDHQHKVHEQTGAKRDEQKDA